MSLTIKQTRGSASSIRLSLVGRLDTNTAPELESELESLLASNIKTLVFDLEGLDYISSAGLRVIFKAITTLKKQGGRCCMLKLQPLVRKVFDIVQAIPDDVPVFDQEEAIQGFLTSKNSLTI